MSYSAGENFVKTFATRGSAGVVDADSLPTAVLAHNGTNDGAVTVTIARVSTGRYKATGTIPSGYLARDQVEVIVSAAVASVTDLLVIDMGPLDGGSGVAGGSLCTLTMNDGSGNPIAGMSVWVSSDAAGKQIVAGVLVSDSQGEVPALLVAGATYYLWAQKTGENPILGRSFTAAAD